MIRLSDRLAYVASKIEKGASVVDVGTDHGYIPAYLAANGICEKICASDIRKGPLSAAVRTAEENGVGGKIEFCVADGLEGVLAEEYDTVVIAGMGGETIAGILEAAPWTRDGVKLILQPQTKTEELSLWLDENGYKITDAGLVKDTGRIYLVLCAEGGNSRAPFTCAQMYVDRILMEKRDPLLPEYLDRLIDVFERRLSGMESSDRVRIDEHDHVMYALKGFRMMKEETEKW